MKKLYREKMRFYRYKGLIIDFRVRAFFIGKIISDERNPFSSAIIKTYEKYGVLRRTNALLKNELKPPLSKSITKYFFSTIKRSPRPLSNPFINLKCNRCKNKNRAYFIEFQCSRCQKTCYYCRHCIQMGRISRCTKLFIWKDPSYKITPDNRVSLQWRGKLSPLQENAANELIRSFLQNKNHLVHAVCGAGKTELLFPVLNEALKSGKRVCVATPRTDVVLELYPRFCQAFPQTNIHALYAGAKNNDRYAPFILSTTHQLYHYEHAFDLVIVDEADAFPYTYDPLLKAAVHKSRKPHAPIIYVTATPSKQLLREVRKTKANTSRIPIRYHQHLLPVPKNSALWGYKKAMAKGKLPLKLINWLKERAQNNEPFLLFFPEIQLMQQALPLVQKYDATVRSVHAEDPERKEKVMHLREGKVNGLLTTTILERGVTIKNVQVAIIGAENKIFTASALIQIAGRVGRHQEFHDGDVTFFHHGITLEMDQAIQEIKRLNEEASKVAVRSLVEYK